jgi:formylglycine-generating enzyme required for sulfatase activity
MVLGEEVPRDENLINTAKAITVFRAIGRQELKTEPSEKFPHMAPLIYIPGGAFRMGGNTDIDNFVEDIELPVHEVLISEFWIEETEVSNINYKQCVEAGSCSKPLATSSATRPNYYVDPEYDSYPVINVNYEQARTYCQWAGGRLPTEAEWEKAARFGGNLIYPWGFGPPSPENNNPNSINHSNIFGDTNPIFSLTFPNLIHHLAGNVWEWVSDWHSGDYYSVSPESNPTGPETGTERVVRGGSWSSDPEFLRTTNRFSRDPENGYDNVGFRCVTTEDPYP